MIFPNGYECLPQRPLTLVAVGALVRARGTDWALGAEAWSRALVSDGTAATAAASA